MNKFNIEKVGERVSTYSTIYKFIIKYGADKSITKCINLNNKFNTDVKMISYIININCESIDDFSQKLFGCYSFGVADCKKEISIEYYDAFGEMVNKYEMSDKFNNHIYITPINGIIDVSIIGKNKLEDYEFFDELVVNALNLMELDNEKDYDQEESLGTPGKI